MADKTAIEWCDATLNLWWGCTKVSDGCKFCYAEQLSDQRFEKGAWGPGGIRTEVKSWRSTLNKVSQRAKAEGRRLRVFCQSMSDTFEGSDTCGGRDSDNWQLMQFLRFELLRLIGQHPELDFLLLTKRPENVVEHVFDFLGVVGVGAGWCNGYPSNLWIGTSVEDQKTADERIPHLLKIPAAVRFLSCEPLLGPVDLSDITQSDCNTGFDPLTGRMWGGIPGGEDHFPDQRIHWVICGGESGPHARPMHPDWARSLRDQCQAAGVPFLFKQWGEYHPRLEHGVWPDTRNGDCDHLPSVHLYPGGEVYSQRLVMEGKAPSKFNPAGLSPANMKRVGKKRAGRVLDGRTWDEFPGVTA